MPRQRTPSRQKRVALRITDKQEEAYLAEAERCQMGLSEWAREALDKAAGLRGEKKREVA